MKTEASWSTSAPVFIDCFDAGMINIILTVILYSYLRHAISNVNKVVIKQIGNFPFVTNNPVIFFQDNVIGLLTFSMQKGAESRPEFAQVFGVCCFLREVLFYCFSPKRGAGNTLSFECLVFASVLLCVDFFHSLLGCLIALLHCSVIQLGHLITTYHCLLDIKVRVH